MADPSADPLAASLPIVDAHHHFWDLSLNAHPWLTVAPLGSFRYGDYAAIRRTYLLADYHRDTARFNVVKTVYVEAEWDPREPIGETRWVHERASREGLPQAMVAQAWLDRTDAAHVLAEQAAFPLVRSVRHKPRSAARPEEAMRGAPARNGGMASRSSKGTGSTSTCRRTGGTSTPRPSWRRIFRLQRSSSTTRVCHPTGAPMVSRAGAEQWSCWHASRTWQ